MHKLGLLIFLDYFFWHYHQAWKDLFRLFLNITYSVNNFFDFGDLLKNLFSPFKRVFQEKEKGGIFSFNTWFENLIANIFSRFIGFILRTTLIIFGIVSLLATVIFFVFLFLIWTILPFLFLYLMFFGLSYIIKGLLILL